MNTYKNTSTKTPQQIMSKKQCCIVVLYVFVILGGQYALLKYLTSCLTHTLP